MRRRHRSVAAAVVMLLGLGSMAACGSDSNSAEMGEPAPSVSMTVAPATDASSDTDLDEADDSVPAATTATSTAPTSITAATTIVATTVPPSTEPATTASPSTLAPDTLPPMTVPARRPVETLSPETAPPATQPSEPVPPAVTLPPRQRVESVGFATPAPEPDPATCPAVGHAAVVDRAFQRGWLCDTGAIVWEMPITSAITQPEPGVYPIYAKDLDASSTFGGHFSTMTHFVAFARGIRTGARVAFHSVPVLTNGEYAQPLESVGMPEYFGQSSGCVRVLPDDAVRIWDWLAIGDVVIVIS